MFGAMNAGKLPFEPLLNAYALIFAGLLFIFPGFLSDIVALLLLIPPVRHWLIMRSLSRVMPRSAGSGPSGPARTEQGNVVIEGTYQRLDEDDEAPKSKP
jgi:UPF0716 protein FxsA